ncbi:MAG: DUF456 family protein [Gemmatimonas sp.]|nr:DUF456 family protein [Gemmatimonas sp.]
MICTISLRSSRKPACQQTSDGPLAYLLLAIAQGAGLLITPFGWPGLWLQLASLALFGWWSGFEAIAGIPLVLLFAVVALAELIEAAATGGRIDAGRRRRTSVGAFAGAAVGAMLGIPFPLVGHLFGALIGAFVGSVAAAIGVRGRLSDFRDLGGEAIAMAVKTSASIAVAVFAILTFMP